MPNWKTVLQEIEQDGQASPHDRARRKYLKKLSEHTGRNVVAYYSGFLSKPGIPGTEINDEDKNGYMLCIHELDRAKGLDLILHTPGGDGQATVSLVEYLRRMFGKDIRAIVPQIAMSAGTMIACSCKEIVMANHSDLGPVDPQFSDIAAVGVLAEVNKAHAEIVANPATAAFWAPRLNRLNPSFVNRCEQSIIFAENFLKSTLSENMFSNLPDADQKAAISGVMDLLQNLEGRSHSTHLGIEKCRDAGLNVSELEKDKIEQDLVLTIHHAYMHTLSNTNAIKAIENHDSKCFIKMLK